MNSKILDAIITWKKLKSIQIYKQREISTINRNGRRLEALIGLRKEENHFLYKFFCR